MPMVLMLLGLYSLSPCFFLSWGQFSFSSIHGNHVLYSSIYILYKAPSPPECTTTTTTTTKKKRKNKIISFFSPVLSTQTHTHMPMHTTLDNNYTQLTLLLNFSITFFITHSLSLTFYFFLSGVSKLFSSSW